MCRINRWTVTLTWDKIWVLAFLACRIGKISGAVFPVRTKDAAIDRDEKTKFTEEDQNGGCL